MDATRFDAGAAVRRARAELNAMQQARLGPTLALADTVVAVLVPLVLWNDSSRILLVAWSVLVAVSSLGWVAVEHRRRARPVGSDSWLTWFGWLATVIWGSLPWIVWPALPDRGVVWVLVFVVLYAIVTDTVFVTQTSSIAIDEMMLVYSSSFLFALALNGAWAALVAVVASGAIFAIGGAGLGHVSGELVAQRVESERRTRVDHLTGVGTRAAATEAVQMLLREGAERIHCAFFDVDDFKQVNDNYGYEVGDAALRVVAGLIVDALPEDWVVARFGGDEFVAVGATTPELQRILDAPVSLSAFGGLVLSQAISVGVTTRPAADASADLLFQEGAAALRLAKRLGKRQVVEMTDELREAERTTTRLAARTEAALADREIVPWAQPVVELHNGRIAGLELLARWPQPDGSMVMPDRFVPVIEDQGRGPALGLLMLRHAVEALAGPELRDSSVYVSVNVSARHLFHRRLPDEILDMLREHRVAPRRLVLEITESQHLPSSPVWRETARRLRAMGVGLAIDDFGTGYSSLEQLMSMPFSHLKLDKVITQAVDRPGAAELAAAIAGMANGSDMVTIAEGIETEEQRRLVRAAGCSYGQGYLFARPAPLQDVLVSTCAPTRTTDVVAN